MARYKGYNGYAEVEGTEIGERMGFNLEITVNELDSSTQGNAWAHTDGGQMSATGTIELFRDPADAGQVQLAVNTVVSLTLYPEGNTTGLTEISGDFLITSLSVESTVGELVKNTINVVNNDNVTIAQVA